MSQLFRLPSALREHPAVEAWLAADDDLRCLARRWFHRMRACGTDVRELMHDGQATACVEDAAFAYVAAYRAHVNVGFFNGADLDDPAGLLEGTGRRMRHVKLRWGAPLDEAALEQLIAQSYKNVRRRLEAGD